MDKYVDLPADANQAQQTLRAYLDEANTVICVVFGAGLEADKADAMAQTVSKTSQFANSRVIRVRDTSVLTGSQRGDWMKAGAATTFLSFTRNVIASLNAADAAERGFVTDAFTDAEGADQR